MITGGYEANPGSGYNEPSKNKTWLWILVGVVAIVAIVSLTRR